MHASVLRSAALLALAMLGACAAPGPPIPVTTGSLLDDYEMVSGVAEGRVLGSEMTRGQVLRIVELDRAARQALLAAASDPSAAARAQARDAIRALAEDASAPTGTGPTLVVTARRAAPAAAPPPP